MRNKLHDEDTWQIMMIAMKESQQGRKALLALQFEIASHQKQLCGGGTRTYPAGGGTQTHPAGSTIVRCKKTHSRARKKTLALAFKKALLSSHHEA